MNLLLNGDFDLPPPRGHEGWTRVNGLWPISPKPSNPSPNHTAAQFDADYNKKTGLYGGWPMPSEDWLSQVVQAPDPHTMVSFAITEIHHVDPEPSVVWIALEGSDDGVNWAEIWRRDGLASIPRATSQWDWYTNAYPVESDHSYYRLTFYGKYMSYTDGWKITLLGLEIS